MAKPITTDLRVLPRPFTLIADLLTIREGKRVSPQAVEICHRKAMAKLRKRFAELGIDVSELKWERP